MSEKNQFYSVGVDVMKKVFVILMFIPSILWASEWPNSESGLKSFKSSLERDYFKCNLDSVVGIRDGEFVLLKPETVIAVIGRDVTKLEFSSYADQELDWQVTFPAVAASSRSGYSFQLNLNTRRAVVTMPHGLLATGVCELL